MSYVKHEIGEDGVAIVTLDNPNGRNALSRNMVADIVATFNYLEGGEGRARAIVLTGSGPAFCAGADLKTLGSAKATSLRDIYEGFTRIYECRLPVLAAVQGSAVGAGVNMALVCDTILVSESAMIDTRFTRLAIHPGGGHTWMLRNLVGPYSTAAMVMFAERIDGREAERIGFAWKCFPDDQLIPEARKMAQRAAAASPELIQRIKQNIREMIEVDEYELAIDKELIDQMWSTGQPEFTRRLNEAKARAATKARLAD